MNWDAIGAVGELVGAIAVVGTIVFLATQMRQSAKAVSAQTYESIMSGYNQLNLARATDKALSVLWEKGIHTPQSLDQDETTQIDNLILCYVVNYLKIFRMYEKDVIDRLEFGGYADEATALFAQPGGVAFLERNPQWKWLVEILQLYQRSDDERRKMRERLLPGNR